MSLFSFPTLHSDLFEPFDAFTSPFLHIVSDSDDEDDYDLQVPSKRPQRAIAHSKSKSKPTATTELSLTRPSLPSTLTSFTPKFDVREKDDAYYLDGEMPGVEQKDVDIEFVDEQTLQIKGFMNRVYEDTNVKEKESEKQNENENESEAEAEMTDGESDASSAAPSSRSRESSPYQATVEDVDEDGNPKQTKKSEKSEQPSSPSKAVTKETETKEVAKNEKPQWKYWVSERSMGSFQRMFRFTEKVDQDNVRASLRNGVLSVVVPKEVKNVKRRKITIE
ncbi:hypothetical protein KEM55_003136 [Ascosphaera atra]|nr:hypothetical protein KEM55_003136 [Ascosphaera atra]